MATGPTPLREILAQIRQSLKQSKVAAKDTATVSQLLGMCDELEQVAKRRQAAFDRFEREPYLAASEEVRETAYKLATALGRLLPDQRALAERLVAGEGRPQKGR